MVFRVSKKLKPSLMQNMFILTFITMQESEKSCVVDLKNGAISECHHLDCLFSCNPIPIHAFRIGMPCEAMMMQL